MEDEEIFDSLTLYKEQQGKLPPKKSALQDLYSH